MEAGNDSRDQQSTVSSSAAAAGGFLNVSLSSGEGGSSPARKSLSPNKSDENNSSFERLSVTEVIEASTLVDVIKSFRDKQYVVSNNENLAEGKVKYYFDKDYRCEVVYNEMCPNYPSGLIIPVAEKENGEEKVPPVDCFDKGRYSDMIKASAHARIRSRYPVPVILFDNKFICRSGTVANELSAAYNKAMEARITPDTPIQIDPESTLGSRFWIAVEKVSRVTMSVVSGVRTILWSDLRDLLRNDVKVLMYLKVDHVCDLMVEYNKVFKDILSVSSSEIQHKDIYRKINVEDLPFPGCEFFKQYSEADRNPVGLMFDWSRAEVTRQLILSDDLTKLIPELDVSKLKEWDLVQMTKMYLKIILAYLAKDKGSVLVHCISGWDRTPLFISLLRLSLWADNVVHQSLEPVEIAYLTVTYDWVLFGHDFPNRWAKKEEIMHFCFNFLSYMTSDEFSITKMFESLPDEEKENRQFPKFEAGRRVVLDEVRKCVLDAYKEHVIDRQDDFEKIDV